jgi:hypothetical protein
MDRSTMWSCAAACCMVLGCGRDVATSKADPHDPMAATATGKKPCEYMARADAETALGLPLSGTTENVTLGECNYTTPEFYGAALTVGDWDGIKRAATGGGHVPKVVTGVGDEALNLGGNLYVRKGSRGFLLSLNGPAVDGSADKGLARATVLAQTILLKL